jgi:hypothetical protein
VPPLKGVYPHAETPLLTITDVYRAARYRDRPATAADAAAAEAAFNAIASDTPHPADHAPTKRGTS